MLRELLLSWPVIKQIQTGGDGTGPEAMSQRTLTLRPRTAETRVARSICPYCGVGCGQLIFHKDNKLISIEGDPESPISRGRLCPKGADSYELLTHPQRELKVKYRRPFASDWEDLELETAMDMIAERVWESRATTFVEQKDGQTLMQTKAIGHLGGATLDNEENYLIKKLFTGGLEKNERDGRAFKCTFCSDRQQAGLIPACAKACPTESIKFGDLQELRSEAQARIKELNAQGIQDAVIYDPLDTSVKGIHAFFLVRGDPAMYNLPPRPEVPTRYLKKGWTSAALAAGAMLGATLLAFLGEKR